jgi:hypothetical protein
VARVPKTTGTWTALLIALAFGLFLAWTQSTSGPSRAELATVLSHDIGRGIRAADIKSVRCDETASIVYQCRWQQLENEVWQERQARLAANAAGWHLVPEGR